MTPALPGLDLDRLAEYLASTRPELATGPLTGQLLPGGRSNLTYVVTDGAQEWVLRRPPLGHVLGTAHDMAREHRVISALAETEVPVPEALLLCTDPAVLGAPFYLMSRVDGEPLRSPKQTAALTTDRATGIATAMMATLAALHRVDPAAVALTDFGRPAGFLGRQVRRWSTQLANSRSREVAGIDELAARLADPVPDSPAPAIVHGDFRLENLLIDGDRITAVLDWEMSTLGDPLTDLGLLLVYWEIVPQLQSPLLLGVGPAHGFPAGAQLRHWYQAATGHDTGAVDWYVALGCFKLAVILEGIHYRYCHGLTVGDGFDHIGPLVPPLVGHGLAALASYES
ncbi:phosphotransferase family protein [Natronosporangium hydrolyticum]|uniref:Phosphotransferase family protein n=1 Tax=Natronosporangium hydrolyticum TaxID=2811111 RepID=A0A895YBW6_9ACTN|nr:phosphotransferase family protein [Natronosporangium hydrolyticum]QSB13712.1 phosphotransferase family protein [Natronosporangium hydrolyticum]